MVERRINLVRHNKENFPMQHLIKTTEQRPSLGKRRKMQAVFYACMKFVKWFGWLIVFINKAIDVWTKLRGWFF
jgi:hypothetical protein